MNCSTRFIATSPALVAVLAAAEKGEELTHEQQIHMRHIFIALMNAFENQYVQLQESGEADWIAETAEMR